MMPSWQEWWEKSEQAIKTAEKNYQDGDLMGAANRLWYAIYQGAHAVLIFYDCDKTTRKFDKDDNWNHDTIQRCFRREVLSKVETFEARESCKKASPIVPSAFKWRL